MPTQLTTTKDYFNSPEIQNHIQRTLGEKSKSFITSVLTIVAGSAALNKCQPQSIYQCALVATTLDLPLNQNLGYAYIIPYGDKAQFQVGYKGFIQLAQRSGKYLNINCVPVYDQDEEHDVKKRLTSFLPQKNNGTLIGYCGYFKLLNGFEQTLSMSIDDLQKHGKKYSKSYGGLWTSDFESMARKTVIKLLLQRFGPMSIEMEKATLSDQSVIKNAETMELEHIDNGTTVETLSESNQRKEHTRIIKSINECTDVTQIEEALYELDLSEAVLEAKNQKIAELKSK